MQIQSLSDLNSVHQFFPTGLIYCTTLGWEFLLNMIFLFNWLQENMIEDQERYIWFSFKKTFI